MSQSNTHDECIELKNIEYQTMLQTNNTIAPKKRNIRSLKNIDEMLEREYNRSTSEIPWSKLDKIYKLEKLNIYAEKVRIDYNLNDEELVELKKYLKQCLDRKQLQKTKDINYDKQAGLIKSIPGLQIKKVKDSSDVGSGSDAGIGSGLTLTTPASASTSTTAPIRRFTLKNIDREKKASISSYASLSNTGTIKNKQRMSKLKMRNQSTKE
jgi:hypothetical protein